MNALISAELYKLRRRPACWLTGVIAVSVIAFFYALMATLLFAGLDTESGAASLEDLRDTTSLENSTIFGYGIVQFVVSTLGIILMALVITSEYSWRTVLTTVNWAGERGRVLVARMLVVLGFLAIGIGLGWLVAAAGSVAIGLADGSLSFDGVDASFAGNVIAGAGRTWLTVAVYAMLAAALSQVSRNLAIGIGVALVVRFMEPVGVQIIGLMPGGVSSLQHLLIAPNVDALLQANGVLDPENAPARDLPGVMQATVYLIGFCVASGAVAVLSFVRQDIDV